MKSYALALLALVAVVAVGITLAAMRSVSPRHVPPPPVVSSPTAATPAVAAKPLIAPPPAATAAPVPAAPPQRFTVLADTAAAQARIEQLTATFNANDVPELAAYLSHPDATIRQAAHMGLLVLGDPAASPYLHAAANALLDPAEAAKLRESATFLVQPKLAGAPAPHLTPAEAAQRQIELREQVAFDPLLSPANSPVPSPEPAPTPPTPFVQP